MKKNYNGKFSNTTEQIKNSRRKVPFKRKFKHFIRVIKKSIFFRFIMLFLFCFIIFFSGRIYQSFIDKNEYTKLMEAQKAEIVAEYEIELRNQSNSYEAKINDIRVEYETADPEELIKIDSEYLAKMLDGYRYNDARALRTAIWCALNRVDHPAYPDSVKTVCEQPSQWMGYSSSNPILTDLYEIAEKEVRTWYNNYRPVSEDYVYMRWSSKEIILRDTWEIDKNTHYWQAG